MIKKIIFMAGIILAFFSTAVPEAVFARDLSREEIMDREMACISERMKNDEALSWQDICYTDTAVETNTEYYPEVRVTAYDESEFEMEREPSKNSLTNFEIGGEASYITYEEPNFMKDKGEMFGIFAALTHRISQNSHIEKIEDIFSDDNIINMFRIEGKFSWGEMDYDSQGTGSMEDVEDYMIEGRFLAGYDIPVLRESRITPYLGVGYRYLNDDSGGRVTTTGHYGYEREAHYVYLPIGFETNFPMSNGWSWGTTLEYDAFLGGKQDSHLEDVDSGFQTLSNDQESGFGLRGAMRLTKVNNRVDFFLEPFIRYWHIDDSEISPVVYSGTIAGYGLEPENKSTEFGAKAGVQF